MEVGGSPLDRLRIWRLDHVQEAGGGRLSSASGKTGSLLLIIGFELIESDLIKGMVTLRIILTQLFRDIFGREEGVYKINLDKEI